METLERQLQQVRQWLGSQPPRVLGMLGSVLALVFVLGCLIGTLAGGAAGVASGSTSGAPTATHGTSAASMSATPKPTATATPKPTAKVVLTFKGNGEKSSASFTVKGTWELAFSCSGVPSGMGDAPLYINVYDAKTGDEQLLDDVSYNCPEGAKGGKDTVTMHGGGTFYLHVITGINYSITVKDMPD